MSTTLHEELPMTEQLRIEREAERRVAETSAAEYHAEIMAHLERNPVLTKTNLHRIAEAADALLLRLAPGSELPFLRERDDLAAVLRDLVRLAKPRA